MNIEGWDIGQLGETCSITIGGTPSRSNPIYWDVDKSTDNLWVSIRDMNQRVITDTAEYLNKEGVKNSNVKLLAKGTIILSFKLTIGRVAIAGKNLYTNEAIAGLVNSQISPNFLYYGLQQWDLLQGVDQAIKGATLNKQKLNKIQFNYPKSIKEQEKIAEVLSTIDRAIAQTEAIIAKQQRIKTGLMQDLLTKGIDENGNIRSEATHQFKDSAIGRIPVEWEVEPIEQKLERIIDYRGRTPKKVTEGVPLLTAKNVRDGFIEKEPQEFIADSDYNSWMTRGIPEVGDVLFTTEAPMGNVASIPNYRIALAQRLLTLCPKINELSQDFLFWILHWKRTTERFELLTSGSTVVGVKQSVFRKVNFTFPSYIEQQRICAVLNSHDEINKNEKHKLKKIQRLKTGLMQDLLTGKVRVTNLLKEREPTSL
jgi:type I restriction enzyme S subunit